MESPLISLVICTRNRCEQLRACLEYIDRIETSCAWELIVVDNGSTDDTGAMLAAYAAKAPTPTTILYEETPGKGRGLNRALPVARGELIAFSDDDCYLAPDFIDRIQPAFDDPRIGFVGCRIELFDPADYPTMIYTSRDPFVLEARSFVQPGRFPGAGMTFRRCVLDEIGGFDPDWGPGARFWAGEDPEIQARASFAGWWGAYVPEAVIAHHHRRKAKDVPPLRRNYSMGTGAYMAKFVLTRETRPIYLRNWYWTFRRTLAGGYAYRDLFWEIEGALRYVAYRLGKRIRSA